MIAYRSGPKAENRCTNLTLLRRLSELFDQQRKQIERLWREKQELEQLLQQERQQADRRHAQDAKRIAELEKENKQLKRQLKSLLSPQYTVSLSTPSSQQPVYTKPSVRKRRCKPGRKRGHQGSRRPTPVHIDQTVEHRLSQCPICQNPLGQPCGQHVRIIEDIPEVRPVVTQHVIYEYRCGSCRKKVSPPVIDALPRAALGLRLTLLTAFLHYALGMTTRKICAWLQTFCQFHVTPGGLVLSWQRLAELFLPIYRGLGKEAKYSALLNVDESGWRIGGTTAWIWCFTSKTLAYYVLTPSRAGPVVKKVLGSFFNGILITDFFGAYNHIQAFAKQRCIVHLLREIKQVSLRNGSQQWQAFARRLKRLLHDALKLVLAREKISTFDYQNRVANLHIRLANIFGHCYRDKDCERLAKRLAKHSNELLTFLLHPDVPANNNHAERQIRFAVVMRKNSYGNGSKLGAQTQAILMSIFRTCQLRGIDPIAFLTASAAAAIQSGSPLPIPEPVYNEHSR